MNRRRAAVIGAGVLALALWTLLRAGLALVVFYPSESPDAIVTLASHEWERLPATVVLAQQYPASRVLLTVPAVITASNCHRCGERMQWLIDHGVRADRIQVLPDRGSSTHDEALAARRYAERHQVRSLAIVTSPYHTRRALATFRNVFADVSVELGIYPACHDSPADPSKWWAHEYDRAYVAYEWTAALDYRYEFGVPFAGGPGSDLPVEAICSWGGTNAAILDPASAEHTRRRPGPLQFRFHLIPAPFCAGAGLSRT